MKKIYLHILLMVLMLPIVHQVNAQCSTTSSEAAEGAFSTGFTSTFETTAGGDLIITFELLDTDKVGVVAFLWEQTPFSEVQMANVSGNIFSTTISGKTSGTVVNYACKFAYAGGLSRTNYISYEVGTTCSTGANATLSDLKVDGNTIAGFSANTESYAVVLADGVTVVPTVTFTTTIPEANAVLTAATTVPGTTSIVVTSSDESVTITYTVAFVYGTPSTAATDPTDAAVDVIAVYSDSYDDIYTNLDPNWGQATDATEIQIGDNNVLKYTGLNYQGIEYTQTNVSSMEYIHLDYYTNDATAFEFYLIAGGENSYNIGSELGITKGAWTGVDIEISSAYPARNLAIADQFKTTGNGTIFLDNIYFWKTPPPPGSDISLSSLTVDAVTIANFTSSTLSYNVELAPGTTIVPTVLVTTTDAGATAVVSPASSIPGTTTITVTSANSNVTEVYSVNFVITTPAIAAPTPPARDPSEVISVFSDAYTDISGSTFDPNWGENTQVTIENIAGNDVLKYTPFSYQGTVLGSHQDLTTMNFVHLDMWTPDATAVTFKLISNTTGERGVSLAITQGEWQSYDFPLSDFTSQGLTISDIKELKIEGGNGSQTIFLDNIYFYQGEEPTIPTALSAYCSANVFDNNSTPDSEVLLTISNTSPTTLVVEIESADGNAVNNLIVQLGGESSQVPSNNAGVYTMTLNYASAPATVSLQLLWGKENIGGLRQLNLTDVPFGGSCNLPATLTITTDQTTSGDVECGDLVVAIGQTYTVAAGHTLVVLGDMTLEGNLVINSGASLITNDGNVTGNVTIKRNTRYAGGRYSFVGSPVEANASITGSDLGSTVYWYDETVAYGADGIARWKDASAEELTPGWGYAQAFQQEIIFTGVPNDGTISVSGLSHTALDDNHDEHGWSLLSNPYPAAIDLGKFLDDAGNAALLNGAVYLWDDHGSETGRGDNGDYVTANGIGNVGGPNGGSFNNYIGSMQGFFVKIAAPNANATVNFTESMRVGGVNSDANFFRKAEVNLPTIKLAITTADNNFFNELLVALRTDATIGIDQRYDADKLLSGTDLQFYSLINDNKFAIQGLPLSDGMSAELAFDLGESSDLMLSVQEISGLEDGMSFYILDKLTGIVYNLNEVNEFAFTSAKGSDQNRFTLTYASSRILANQLSVDQPIYRFLNNELNVKFNKNVQVSGYFVYDLSGKTLIENNGFVGQIDELNIPISSKGISIIRIVTSEGTFTRKFLF